MKKLILLLVIILAVFQPELRAQDHPDSTQTEQNQLYLIVKNDGAEYVGYILKQDEKEVLIDTEKLGRISIPKHEIREIRKLDRPYYPPVEQEARDSYFGNRYFLNNNAIPIRRGEPYVIWSLWGPDFQFPITDNFGMGITTSWLGFPVIGSAKYSIEATEDFHIAVGAFLGTGSWVLPSLGITMPYATLTYGNDHSNISFMAGYGAVFFDGDVHGNALMSVGGLLELSPKFNLLFDSYIFPDIANSNTIGGFALLLPGFRLDFVEGSSFQFGFGGLIIDGEVLPAPIPVVQWAKTLN